VSPSSRSCPHRRHEAAAHSPTAPGAGLCAFQVGSTITLLGDGLFTVAIAWQVYDIWNVPTAFAIVGVAETVSLVGLLLVRNTETPGHREHVDLSGRVEPVIADEEGARRLPVGSLSSDQS
jgi:hypothetical protein